MALLGEDGRGYELARRLENQGVWRSWLGDSLYANFVPSLSSPSTWEAFMRADDSKSRAQIHLQLRARALLFDKASVSLFLSPPSSAAVAKLNPNYLQLHGDDVYFTLEDEACEQDGVVAARTAPSKIQSKAATSVGSRYGEKDMDNVSQRYRHDDLLPESWLTQFFEKYRATKPYKLLCGDWETDKRSPEQMATYLRILDKQKRRRVAFKEDEPSGFGNAMLENESHKLRNSGLSDNDASDDEMYFFPETMFPFNCVPDSALPLITRVEEKHRVEFNGVLDMLPQIMTRSPIMIERLGIRPEYLNMEQGGHQYRGKVGSDGNRKLLAQEQASELSRKVVARVLANVGYEASSQVSVEVLSQFLSCHICKLGRILKVLADNYKKQCSAIELVKMFLQTAGNSNLGALAELVKDSTRNSAQQAQQQIQVIQSQMQPQQQAPIRQAQQIPRPIYTQMPQMVNSQNLAFQQQQQLERMRRRQQQAATRPGMNMNMENVRPLVEVKIENPEFPIESNAFGSMNPQIQLRQFRQQQLAALSNFNPQASSQFRQLASLQIPQAQTPSMGTARAPPVKVEGFQELMGGDATLRHDSEENKLTSPPK
ncbi:uncharacterized protein LOC127800328 [Diospyros lotus]|uniref:uncharacterized protein LOC127800328 n=1 Tax=Diospyros lotus TaxID=55363 RepID=UPI002257F19B|nr:uncharacterized protein LOC127800328 [Diospyros lotus]